MTIDHGTLNGQPVGPELPPPVPCERCGHPVWHGRGVVVHTGADWPRHLADAVWELSIQPDDKPWQTPPPWRLAPHWHRPRPSWDPVANLRAHHWLR